MRYVSMPFRICALLVALVLSVGAVIAPAAANQGTVGSYVFESSGDEATWTDDWTFIEESNFVDEYVESIALVSVDGIQLIAYLPSGLAPEEARDAFLSGTEEGGLAIESVDRGSYDDVSYSLDIYEDEEELWAMFTVVTDSGQFTQTYVSYAPASSLGDTVDTAAADIEIEGRPILAGVEGDGLQDLVDEAAEDFDPDTEVENDSPITVNDDDEDDDKGQDEDDTENRDDEADESDTGNLDGDLAGYLGTVSDNYDLLSASVVAFDAILAGELTDESIAELNGILELWMLMSDDASGMVAPEGLEEFHVIYQEYTWALGESAVLFLSFLQAEPESAEQEQYLAEYQSARANAAEYEAMLGELLVELGY